MQGEGRGLFGKKPSPLPLHPHPSLKNFLGMGLVVVFVLRLVLANRFCLFIRFNVSAC